MQEKEEAYSNSNFDQIPKQNNIKKPIAKQSTNY